jgi:hypothetical protein
VTEQDQVFGGIGDSAFGSALFIDGKLTSGQTRGGLLHRLFIRSGLGKLVVVDRQKHLFAMLDPGTHI